MANLEVFENNLLTSGQVIDPEGVHSEFVSGMKTVTPLLSNSNIK